MSVIASRVVAVALRFHRVAGISAVVAAVLAEMLDLTLTAGMCAFVRIGHAILPRRVDACAGPEL
jgi:hypothetical protein